MRGRLEGWRERTTGGPVLSKVSAFSSAGKLLSLTAGGWSLYVGPYNYRGVGHTLLVLIDAVFPPDTGTLRH